MGSIHWSDVAANFPFHLAVVAEEIGDDFAHVLGVVKELGIEAVEFGTLWGEPVAVAAPDTLKRAKHLLEQHEIAVCAISPTTFKSVVLAHVPLEHIQDEPHVQEELWLLERQIAAAQFFDAPLVRFFSGRRENMVGLGNPSPRLPGGGLFPEEMQAKVARLLQLACRAAPESQITLAVENVRSCWANSGYNTALLVQQIDSPRIKIIWDPSNGYVSGEEDAYPTGYALVKPYMIHVQIKDAVVEDRSSHLTRWERIGDGECDFVGQLLALKDDGYDGYVSIETHWSPPGGDPERNTRRTYAGMMDILARIRSG